MGFATHTSASVYLEGRAGLKLRVLWGLALTPPSQALGRIKQGLSRSVFNCKIL